MNTSRSVIFGGLVLLGCSACILTGIEPDEIDISDGETGTGATGDGDGDDGQNEAGDGDGDPGGDGDGDDATGDGDPTTTGDGDGDGDNGDGDGDGDGDGEDTGDGDGDGDGDPLDCSGFAPSDLSEGSNQVMVADGVSALASSCGGAGPETVYRFTAPAEGEWLFAIDQSDFTEVLTLVDSCDPLQELACSAAPAVVQRFLSQGQVVYVVVDSDDGTGSATLEISPL